MWPENITPSVKARTIFVKKEIHETNFLYLYSSTTSAELPAENLEFTADYFYLSIAMEDLIVSRVCGENKLECTLRVMTAKTKASPSCLLRKIPYWFLQNPAPIKPAGVRLYWMLGMLLSRFMDKQTRKLSPSLKCLPYSSCIPPFTEPCKTQLTARGNVFWPIVSSLWWLILTFSMQGLLSPMNWGTNYCYELCLGRELVILFFLVIIF